MAEEQQEPAPPLQALLSAGAVCAMSLPNASRIAPEDMDAFIDFWRRVQRPHYEEARRRFANRVFMADFAASNPVLPYLPHVLERTISYYPLPD